MLATTKLSQSVSNAQPKSAASVLKHSDGLVSDIRVFESLETIREAWEELENTSGSTVYQSCHWAEICLPTIEHNPCCKPFIVTGWKGNRLMFVMPLVLVDAAIKRLRWIGYSHVNIGMGLFHSDILHADTSKLFDFIFEYISDKIDGPGILQFGNQPAQWGGIANPLASITHEASVNDVYLMDLSGGFEALLEQGNHKRKRKKFRQQCRTANENGGYKLRRAQSDKEAKELLDIFLQQKAVRFRKMGVDNVFSSPNSQAFLDQLSQCVTGKSSDRFLLFALEIGGEVRAILGLGRHHKQLSGYFSSISEDELSHISPGEMLLYLAIRECCELGFSAMDLGSGDERYKRSWCNSTVMLQDLVIPLSASAWPYAIWIRLVNRVKRQVRSSEKLWPIIRQLRSAISTGKLADR